MSNHQCSCNKTRAQDIEQTESIKVLLEALDIQRKKSTDYQNPNSSIHQADYYPR